MARTWTDENGVRWTEYTDPLAPERANPYRWVDGYAAQNVVDKLQNASQVDASTGD